MTFDREQLAWASGLFEGEGCFCLSKDYSGPKGFKVGINTHTDLDVLLKFKECVGDLGKIYGPYKKMTKDGRPQKTCWSWQANDFETAQAVMALLWPWLCSRRKEKAKECIKEYHLRPRHDCRINRGTTVNHGDEIRRLRKDGETVNNIAKTFGVSKALISRCCKEIR